MDGGHALEGGKGLDGFSGFMLGDAQIVEALQMDPEFGTGAEGMHRNAVSAVMSRPSRIWVMRLVGTCSWRASEAALMLSSFNSSAKCSPGWIASSGTLVPFVVPSYWQSTPTW